MKDKECTLEDFIKTIRSVEVTPFSERSPTHKAAAKIMDMERQKHNQGDRVNHHLNRIRKIIETDLEELIK